MEARLGLDHKRQVYVIVHHIADGMCTIEDINGYLGHISVKHVSMINQESDPEQTLSNNEVFDILFRRLDNKK